MYVEIHTFILIEHYSVYIYMLKHQMVSHTYVQLYRPF